MNHVTAKTIESFGFISVANSMGLASVTVTYLALKATALGEMTPNDGFTRLLKVTTVGTNQKPVCDCLLVNGTNLHPYLAPSPGYRRALVKFSLSAGGVSL